MSAHAIVRCTAYTVAVTAALGCGEPSLPTAPQLTLGSAESYVAQSGSRSKVLQRSKPLTREIAATVMITPEGRSVSLDQAGLIVVFPPGAVSEDLLVTVKADRGNRVLYSFEPHGTRFERPIVIAQRLSLTEYVRKNHAQEQGVHGGYLAGGAGELDALWSAAFAEVFAVTYSERTGGSYVTFTTDHFSGYALASGRR